MEWRKQQRVNGNDTLRKTRTRLHEGKHDKIFIHAKLDKQREKWKT